MVAVIHPCRTGKPWVFAEGYEGSHLQSCLVVLEGPGDRSEKMSGDRSEATHLSGRAHYVMGDELVYG